MAPLSFESVVTEMARASEERVLLLVLDGLGGYASQDRPSELTAATAPNLAELARSGSLGLHDPVGRGITPGSGAGHLGLFGYHPLEHQIGRGALSAAGLGVHLRPGDIAARVNVCDVSDSGLITDRRAGRLPTSETAEICELITNGVTIPDVEIELQPEQDHRALLILRGAGLSPLLADTDPQREGSEPLEPRPLAPDAEHTAACVSDFLNQTRELLSKRARGNFLLLRGFDTQTALPSFASRFKVRPLAVASYPMYLGIARLLGFETMKIDGTPFDEVAVLPKGFVTHDFIFLHIKGTDSAGEDGDFDRKVAVIEQVDSLIPDILSSGVDVIAITGDHSTPAPMAAHSWHPVPVLLSGGTAASDGLAKFDEVNCRQGSLGRFEARYLMPQLLAAAGRLDKYGA